MTQMRARAATTRAAASPVRTLHAIDIENLAGSGRPTCASVTAVRAAYTDAVTVAPMDQMVLACNPGCLVDVGVGWGAASARYRVGLGHDGADWELLDVLEHERVAERFGRVVIASGDGIFAPMAARLAASGCRVTVVSRRTSLAARLALAAQHVIYLPEELGQSAPAAFLGSAA